MQLTTAALALLPLVAATPNPGYSYGGGSSGSSSSSSPSSASAATVPGVQVINVGNGGQTMSPSSVTVPVGEIIEFHFFAGAHNVAQSAFDTPCVPMNATAANGITPFWSGSQAVTSGEGANVFRVVSTGNPMWYYCATQRHCQNGMVGVINPPANGARTIAQYTAAAARAQTNTPGTTVQGGSLVAAGSPANPSGTGAPASTNTPAAGSAGVGGFSQLSFLGLSVAVAAAVGGLVL